MLAFVGCTDNEEKAASNEALKVFTPDEGNSGGNTSDAAVTDDSTSSDNGNENTLDGSSNDNNTGTTNGENDPPPLEIPPPTELPPLPETFFGSYEGYNGDSMFYQDIWIDGDSWRSDVWTEEGGDKAVTVFDPDESEKTFEWILSPDTSFKGPLCIPNFRIKFQETQGFPDGEMPSEALDFFDPKELYYDLYVMDLTWGEDETIKGITFDSVAPRIEFTYDVKGYGGGFILEKYEYNDYKFERLRVEFDYSPLPEGIFDVPDGVPGE